MPFSISANEFFRGPQPLTNSGNGVNSLIESGSFKTPNLFETIQAVRQNELDRQAKQAQIATVLQQLAMAPIERDVKLMAIKKAANEMDPNSFENQMKMGTLRNQMAQQKLAESKLPFEEQTSMSRSGYSLTPNTMPNRKELLSIGNSEEARMKRRDILKDRTEYGIPGAITSPTTGQRFAPKAKNSVEAAGMGEARLKQQTKTIEDIFTTVNKNTELSGRINLAMNSLDKIPAGLVGKLKVDAEKLTNSGAVDLETWQLVKSLLLDKQLMAAGQTKGAISDAEMRLFGEAASNDKVYNPSRIKVVLDELKGRIEAVEKGKFDFYKKAYKEDPREWEDIKPLLESRKAKVNNSSSTGFKIISEEPV